MNRKNNKRFKDTELLIQQSLIELLEGRELRQISVKELCEKAGINRSTFYAHYLDIFDLMEKIDVNMSQNLLEQFAGMVEPHNFLSISNLEVFLNLYIVIKNSTAILCTISIHTRFKRGLRLCGMM